MNNRVEKDTIGEYFVPKNALYGSQTRRSYDAVKVSNQKFSFKIIKNIILIKKVEILSNFKNVINDIKYESVIKACDELLSNFQKYKNHFITDKIQGGAGTSINMNVNEVIANLAGNFLNYEKGNYTIHPNDVINFGQSTNDVFPSAAKITFFFEMDKLISKIKSLKNSLIRNSKKFNVVRIGKTHLQDAVPMKMNRIFLAWAHAMDRSICNLEKCKKDFLILNLGGTAIGTGISQHKNNINIIYNLLQKETGIEFKPSNDFVDYTRHLDQFLDTSNAIKTFVSILSKNCSDLRLLASGPSSGFGEIALPEIQPGSSIMPGKVNPIIPETINQIAFAIYGHNTTITYAVEAGQLELNVFEPIIFSTLLESIEYAKNGCNMLLKRILDGITPITSRINKNIEDSYAFSTLFSNKFGYSIVSKIVLNAVKQGKNVKQELISNLKISENEYNEVINNHQLFPLEDTDE